MDKKKTTKGRQKIAIEKIEKENDCYATFSKRRQGLFKKASELSTLCEADVGLFVFSPTGKPFSFFHPSMEAVVSRFRSGGDDASRLLEAFSRTRVLQLNQMLDKIGEKLDDEVEREKELEQVAAEAMRERWWEMPHVDNLDNEQVEKLMAFMRNLQLELRTKIKCSHHM